MSKEIDILLVEDNPSDAEMTLIALSRNGLSSKIYHVKDGAEALDYIFAEGKYADLQLIQKPKVILLDLKLPKVNGIEVLLKIKSDERTKNIPVIILTSSREDPDIQKCYNLGVNSYVVKPVEFDEFQKVISELGLYWTIINQQPQ
jgi:two-component system, response regulator